MISTAEAAEHLNMATQTLAGWRSAGKGPPYYKTVHGIRYRAVELDAWASAQVKRIDPAQAPESPTDTGPQPAAPTGDDDARDETTSG